VYSEDIVTIFYSIKQIFAIQWSGAKQKRGRQRRPLFLQAVKIASQIFAAAAAKQNSIIFEETCA
jgi:hypothetical protein